MSQQIQIRPYESADRERFLSLYQTVWDQSRSVDWFRWRFEENPYRDGVQMIVAEVDGELVGVEPILPFRLVTIASTYDVYQPVDWMVHPDYRRQGVFTRMTEALFEEWSDDAALFFNFPTDVLLPGLESFDWREVGSVPMRYRIQNPGHFVFDDGAEAADSSRLRDGIVSLTESVPSRMLRLLDRSVRRPRDVDVERFDTPPVADLRSAYESGVPRRLHLARDEEYLQWRFANPRWRTTTYVGYREGTPEASVVAAVPRRDGLDLVYLLDVQPMATTDASDRSLRAVLGSVVADHEAADLLKAPGGLHQRLFRRFSFLSESFPIDRATNSQRLVVRPLDAIPGSTLAVTDETWQLDGQDLTDPDEWRLTPGDVDFE